MRNEYWRDVPGYEGKYQICIEGEARCRRLYKNGHIKVLSNNPTKRDGRIGWCLCLPDMRIFHQAAVWVALTFPELIENEWFDGAEIDHKDTNVCNNHPSNLRWVTKKENQNNPLTKRHIFVAQHRKIVGQYTLDDGIVAIYESLGQAEKQTGISKQSISACCRNKIKSTGGFIWKYQ